MIELHAGPRFYLSVCVTLFCLVPTAATAGDVGYGQRVRALHPIAYWPLGDLAGNAALDEIGDHVGWYRGGVRRGAAGVEPAGGDAAVCFDGKSGYLRIAHRDTLLLDEGTVAFWFRVDDLTGTYGLFSKDANGFGTGGHLSLTLEQGGLHARLQSSSASHELRAAPLESNRWHLAVFTFGPDGMRLYLDGRLEDANPYAGGLGISSGGSGNHEPLVIGASGMNSRPGSHVPLEHFCRGCLDELAIFSSQLGAEQVASLFASARPRYASLVAGYAVNGPLAWWRLDETPGARIAREQVNEQHGAYHVHGTYFDGDDYVDAGVLDVEGEALTILACVQARSFSVPDARIVDKACGTELKDQFWMLGTAWENDQPRLRFRLQTERGVREVVSGVRIEPGKWLFLAAVYNGREMILYQDGEIVGRFRHSGRIKLNSHCHVWFGDSPVAAGTRPFDGEIRDVAIFSRALRGSQIQALLRAKAPPAHAVPPPRLADEPTAPAAREPADPAPVPSPVVEPTAPPLAERIPPPVSPPASRYLPPAAIQWADPTVTCTCPLCRALRPGAVITPPSAVAAPPNCVFP